MSSRIRVAAVGELPPGEGKVVEVAGRLVTVFNREGRLMATSTRAHAPAAPVETSAICGAPGQHFPVYMEDSPARLREDERCAVDVADGAVWLSLP